MTKKILILEDNIILCSLLGKWLQREGYEVITLSDEPSARRKVKEINVDLVLSDVRLSKGNGISFLEWCMKHRIDIPFIVMTEYANISDAVLAIKMGAKDYLAKPVFEDKLLELVNIILKNPTKVNQKKNFFIRSSPAALKITHLINRVAPSDLSVMILGPNGSGKEVIAFNIHNNSKRRNKPFIAVNCGSISRDLLASEFFGRVKGAYTGAESDSIGYLGAANGGTLFLDEIGNMSYDMQILLLRVLQEREYMPVGSNKILQTDIRILSATNEDMKIAVYEGRFREDLYHRLAEFEIHQPGLSQCSEDIIPLADFFREEYAEEIKAISIGFSAEAKKAMLSYTWPGNIRELHNKVRRAVLLSDDGIITCKDLDLSINKILATYQPPYIIERERIISILNKYNWNVSSAAKELGVSRTTLYKKIEKYCLKRRMDLD